MDAHDTLLAVYYAGHARLSHQTNEAPIWAAWVHHTVYSLENLLREEQNRQARFPALPSRGVQQSLEEAESDVLLLYDSCHSAHPAVNISGQGVTELIVACGFKTYAPAVGPHSFTNALIRELEESFAGPPISVAELHSKVISSLKNWKPSLLRDENGNVWTDENGRAKYECHKRRTPVHCFLTNESPYRSIMLARLPSKSSLTSVANMDKVVDPHKQSAGCEAGADAGELSVLEEEPKSTAEAHSSVQMRCFTRHIHLKSIPQPSQPSKPTRLAK